MGVRVGSVMKSSTCRNRFFQFHLYCLLCLLHGLGAGHFLLSPVSLSLKLENGPSLGAVLNPGLGDLHQQRLKE